jgi:hypothetical protein
MPPAAANGSGPMHLAFGVVVDGVTTVTGIGSGVADDAVVDVDIVEAPGVIDEPGVGVGTGAGWVCDEGACA